MSNGQYASFELHHSQGKKNFYTTCVKRADSSIIPGTRSLNTYPASTIRRHVKALQQDVNNGCWANR